MEPNGLQHCPLALSFISILAAMCAAAAQPIFFAHLFLSRSNSECRERHVGYGVTPEMMPIMGEALMDTLAEELG